MVFSRILDLLLLAPLVSAKTCRQAKSDYRAARVITSEGIHQVGCCGNAGASIEPVRITGAIIGADEADMRKMLADFASSSGIEVVYVGSQRFESDIQEQMSGNFTSGRLPDVALWPQPGAVVAAADNGMLVPLDELGVDVAVYRADFSEYLTGLGIGGDGKVYGGAHAANLKSLFWYQPSEFESRGYAVPATWDQLIALADQIVADGLTPFCEGIYSNGATGWVGTDWMEDIILRTGNGTLTYDKWIRHEIPFNDPEIVAALERWGQIIHADGYIAGGTDAALTTYFGAGAGPMFQRDANGNPGCFMYKQASFIQGFWAMFADLPGHPNNVFTTTFAFPSIDEGLPPAALGGGDMFGVFNDRPETKAVVKHMLSTYFFTPAAAEGGARISANSKFPPHIYPGAVMRSQAEAISSAIAQNSFRFDASDLMPFQIGAGAFWQGMQEFVSRNKTARQVLADIEAAWSAL